MNSLGIYIHIPFCIKKCLYCDFLSFPERKEQQALYFDALEKEISYYASECSNYVVSSVFIGGGTPTSVDPGYIESLMKTLKTHYHFSDDAEITIECNPGTADYEALQRYHLAGINRISIGLQSPKDGELRLLGRIHDREQFERCYEDARRAGFKNVNVDLMSALPGQSLADWESNLDYICGLSPKPEHISAYSLIIEEGTEFYRLYGGKSNDTDAANELPDEDTERDMYHVTKSKLTKLGYRRYEISNYALDGFECSHNKRYWRCEEYLGFGLGAASFFGGKRFHDTRNYKIYCNNIPDKIDSIREETEVLDEKARMEEFMFLGLRLTKGVSARDFRELFHRDINDIYRDVIAKLIGEGLMENEGDYYRLTDYGMDVSNYAMEKFLL